MSLGRWVLFLLRRRIGTPFLSLSVVAFSPYAGPSESTEIGSVPLSLWPGRRGIDLFLKPQYGGGIHLALSFLFTTGLEY
jgi:hypothetical protein